MPAVSRETSTPVADKDRAETFTESDVTLSSDGPVVDAGSVKLGEVVGSTASRPADNSTLTSSTGQGVRVNPNTNLAGVRVTLSSNLGTVSECVLTDASENILDSVAGPHTAGDTIDLEASMSSGTDYHVVIYDGGAEFDYGYYTNESLPVSSTDIDVTNSVRSAHPDDGNSVQTSDTEKVFTDVTALTDKRTSGSVTVEWPHPTDIYAWDTAVFQFTPDGETVDVYIEENQSSGWTEIAGPISRGASIDADPANNVRYRVELSRASTSNNPTLDAIYRRIKL